MQVCNLWRNLSFRLRFRASLIKMAESNSRLYSTGWFPRLTGEYGVGICDVLPSLSEEEPLLIRLFYPTLKKPHEVQQSELYLPESSSLYRYTKSFLLAFEAVPSFLAAPMAFVMSYLSKSNLPAIPHAPLLESKQFPVVVFSHGMTGYRSGFGTFQCDLASHGYIVAAVEHKDGSACLSYTKTTSENTEGGEPAYEDKWIEYVKTDSNALPLRYDQVKQRASEVSLALDFVTALDKGDKFKDLLNNNNFDFSQFKGRIDLSHVVAMGHSFGGSTTVVSLANDLRFRCGVALDSWMFPVRTEEYDLVKVPLIFMNSWDFQWARNVKCMMKLVKESEETGFPTCQVFTLRGSTHLSQTDSPFISSQYAMKSMGFYSPDADIYEVFDASLQLMYAFLNRHLWNDPSPQPILDGGEGQHRLVMSGTNVDISGPDEGWISPKAKNNP